LIRHYHLRRKCPALKELEHERERTKNLQKKLEALWAQVAKIKAFARETQKELFDDGNTKVDGFPDVIRLLHALRERARSKLVAMVDLSLEQHAEVTYAVRDAALTSQNKKERDELAAMPKASKTALQTDAVKKLEQDDDAMTSSSDMWISQLLTDEVGAIAGMLEVERKGRAFLEKELAAAEEKAMALQQQIDEAIAVGTRAKYEQQQYVEKADQTVLSFLLMPDQLSMRCLDDMRRTNGVAAEIAKENEELRLRVAELEKGAVGSRREGSARDSFLLNRPLAKSVYRCDAARYCTIVLKKFL
jgi:hypothetical protein